MQRWIEEMLRQKEVDETLLHQVKQDLSRAPGGELRVSYDKGVARFYRKKDPSGGPDVYLGKKQIALREALAQKTYDLKVQKALEEELKVMDRVLKKPLPTLVDVYASMPADIRQLVEPLVLPDEEYANRWLEKMSRDASGNDLRSRIEVIIDQYYEKHKVPHVYEPSLYLEGYGPARPDFAVLNVRTRQMYYHEHLGMMGDPEYRTDNMRKLRAYHNNGYYEGVNLIITMESDGAMIDYKEVENLIVFYCT